MFPTANGTTDFNSTFYGEESEFYDWCMDYFQYRWNTAMRYDKSKFRALQ
jgi:hypothetical protein